MKACEGVSGSLEVSVGVDEHHLPPTEEEWQRVSLHVLGLGEACVSDDCFSTPLVLGACGCCHSHTEF